MFWMLHEAGASYGAIARSRSLPRAASGRSARTSRASALLGAAERDGGLILELRFEPSH